MRITIYFLVAVLLCFISMPNVQAQVVGSIPGQINVGSSGAASYSIPIDCPAGINGMQPNISLVYNSQSGDGPLGVGWGVSGLSSIIRSTKTIFSDNAISGIALNYDAFALDGVKLQVKNRVVFGSLSGEEQTELKPGISDLIENLSDYINESYTFAGSTFESENKNYSQIQIIGFIPSISILKSTHSMGDEGWFWTTTWASRNTGPRYFKVTTKDGRTIEYTAARNSNIITPGDESANFEWMVSKITDTNGNYMTFSYKTNEGQTVIDRIDYAGNGNVLPTNSIVFNYETKTIIKKIRYGEVYNQNRYLLKSIHLISNNTILQQYNLSYAQRKEKYYLENVSLTGLNNETLNSTAFVWGTDNSIISATPLIAPEPYSQQTVAKYNRYWLSADMTGDGIDDVVNVYPARVADGNGVLQTRDYVQVFKSTVANGQISLTNDAAYDIGTGLSYATLKSANPSVLSGDINGDGKEELVFPKLDLTSGAKIKFQIAGGATYERSLRYSSILPVCAVADINNDGIDEILYLERAKSGQYIYGEVCYTKTNNSKYWESLQINIGTAGVPDRIIVSDLDNDGLKDIMLTHSAGYIQYLNTGNQTNLYDYNPVLFAAGSFFTGFTGSAIIEKGDFNGDGVVDFLTNAAGTKNWNVGLSNGAAFSGVVVPPTTGLFQVTHIDHLVTDFNHDGKSDVVLISHGYDINGENGQTIVNWYASTGIGFSAYRTNTSYDDTSESLASRQYNCTGDFDGDGREDVLSYGSDIYNGNNNSGMVFIQRSFNSNFEANQLKSITNGLGKKTDISYQPLTYTSTSDNKPFYSKGSGSVYPVADVQTPLYCVSKVSEPDGQGGLNATEFAYSEARTQLTGRGFLGFKTQTVSNATTNRKIVSTTDMNLGYGLPAKETTEVSTASGVPVSKTENSYSTVKTGKVFETLPTQTVEWDYLNDLTKTTAYLNFDAYGNSTGVKITQGDLVSTQTSTYVQKGSWCPNKPETVSTTRQQGGDSFTRSKTYTYDDKGNLTKETADLGDVNQLTVEYKNLNAFGQPTTTETTANGMLRSVSSTSTPSGRFIQSKTDVLGQTTTYSWDETRGLLNSETNRIGTTTYTYKGFGQLTNTLYPDGTQKSQTAQWASAGNAFGAKYYITQQASGSAANYTWLDALQREVVRESYGLSGKVSRIFTQYRADGKTYRVSQPTFDTQATAWDAVYDYYPEGRQKTVVTPLGTSTTNYSGKTTTITSPEGTQESTLNAAGQLSTSKVNGKTVTYAYYASGKVRTTTPDGAPAISMEYDLQGNRTKQTDPDAGVSTALYNGYGELKWEKQTNNAAQGEITTNYNYNATTGLIENRVRNGETTAYGYDTQKRLSTIEIAGQHKQTYSYGDYDRVTGLTELINGTKTLVKGMEYDAYGRVNKETFPSGYYTVNNYDSYGNLNEVTDKYSRSIWKATEANARGQITKLNKGIKETVYGYDEAKGQLTSMAAAGVANYSYGYDVKNNLDYRGDNLLGHKEHFSYDSHNRLTNWDIMNSGNTVLKANSISYDGVGNIAAKSDLDPSFTASFNYAQTVRPHALTSVSPRPAAISADELAVTYTDFRKIKTLSENGKNYSISYGVDDQRRMSVQTQGATSLTRYYMGNYEEETDQLGNVKKIHYLSGGAMMINLNGVETLYYGYVDNQGSLIALTDVSGNIVEKYAFDPWGARRNPDDWTQKDNRSNFTTNRGYTGHEHLDLFNIINMNGRLYDPLTAMFFSPDPFIQSAGDWKNYNRYSYCMNNPTKYTDPSGYRLRDQMEQPLEILERLPFTNHGGGGGGLSEWSNHQGSVSYNYDNGKYEYASGAEASTKEAMRNQQIDVPATLGLGFQIAKQQGWAGDYTDFTSLYSQRTARNSYNGTFTLHTFESFYVIGGAGSKQTGSISLILEKGLGGGNLSTLGNWTNGVGVGLGAISLSVGRAIQNEAAYVNTTSLIKPIQTMLKVGPANLLVNNAAITKTLTRTGFVFAGVSAGLTIYDGARNGWQDHHTADLIVNGGLTYLSIACPVAGLVVGGLYFVGDLTSQYYTGKSITQNIFDE